MLNYTLEEESHSGQLQRFAKPRVLCTLVGSNPTSSASARPWWTPADKSAKKL